MEVSQNERSVHGWVDKLLRHFEEINMRTAKLSPSTREKYADQIQQIKNASNYIDIYLECPRAKDVYAKKIETMEKMAVALSINTHLPPPIESLLLNLWLVLLDHAPPDISKNLTEQKEAAEVKRRVFFFSNLPAQVEVLEQQIKYFNSNKLFQEEIPALDWFKIHDALTFIKDQLKNSGWSHMRRQEQITLTGEIMQQLAGIMPRLDLNPAIASSGELGIRVAYESCWCVVNNIARNADRQYKYDKPEGFPKHPLISGIENILQRLNILQNPNHFQTDVKRALRSFEQHSHQQLALEKKYEIIDDIICYITRDCSPQLIAMTRELFSPADTISIEAHQAKCRNIAIELDNMASLLIDQGDRIQRERIALDLDYSAFLPVYVFNGQNQMPMHSREIVIVEDGKPTTIAPFPLPTFLLELAALINEVTHKLENRVNEQWIGQAEKIESIAINLKKQHPISLESLRENEAQKADLITTLTEMKALFINASGTIKHLFPTLGTRLDKAILELGGGHQGQFTTR